MKKVPLIQFFFHYKWRRKQNKRNYNRLSLIMQQNIFLWCQMTILWLDSKRNSYCHGKEKRNQIEPRCAGTKNRWYWPHQGLCLFADRTVRQIPACKAPSNKETKAHLRTVEALPHQTRHLLTEDIPTPQQASWFSSVIHTLI